MCYLQTLADSINDAFDPKTKGDWLVEQVIQDPDLCTADQPRNCTRLEVMHYRVKLLNEAGQYRTKAIKETGSHRIRALKEARGRLDEIHRISKGTITLRQLHSSDQPRWPILPITDYGKMTLGKKQLALLAIHNAVQTDDEICTELSRLTKSGNTKSNWPLWFAIERLKDRVTDHLKRVAKDEEEKKAAKNEGKKWVPENEEKKWNLRVLEKVLDDVVAAMPSAKVEAKENRQAGTDYGHGKSGSTEPAPNIFNLKVVVGQMPSDEKAAMPSATVEATDAKGIGQTGTDSEQREHTENIDAVADHVTLMQMAAIVNKSKRTLERLRNDGKLPTPDVKGGKGKADEWLWAQVKPVLERVYNRELPEKFPSKDFVRR